MILGQLRMRARQAKNAPLINRNLLKHPFYLLLASSWHHWFGNFRKFAIWSGREETQNKRDSHSYSTLNIVKCRDWNGVLELWTISELRSSAQRREKWKRWMPLRDPLCSPPIQGVTLKRKYYLFFVNIWERLHRVSFLEIISLEIRPPFLDKLS